MKIIVNCISELPQVSTDFLKLISRSEVVCIHGDMGVGKDGKPSASDVIRKRHGRIGFAHSELKGYQMWEGAVHEGERAAHEIT